MRSRREQPSPVPAKYRRYCAEDGWASRGDWAVERERWAREQPPVTLSYVDHNGNKRSYLASPLGDLTDLVKAKREARLLADGDC